MEQQLALWACFGFRYAYMPPKYKHEGNVVDWVPCECEAIPCCHDPNALAEVNVMKRGAA